MIDQNQHMETVGLKVKNQMLEQSNAFMKQLVRYPDAAKFRRMSLQFAKDLDILFSDAAATGEWAYTPSSGVMPQTDETPEEFHTPLDAEFHDDADFEVVHPSEQNKKRCDSTGLQNPLIRSCDSRIQNSLALSLIAFRTGAAIELLKTQVSALSFIPLVSVLGKDTD
ncbi:hypothetical protein TEA_029421 [Camellia sinensis var. sinensis]|uniref:Uncharacterized protein n=1 Tax=Camellia sinensis var. sinensis TaxID=542762 RepID=A0A4S4D5J3_CAMSN|nr:hypothetical protein TEA_029421 [Camellia sinensis var. sinensis]